MNDITMLGGIKTADTVVLHGLHFEPRAGTRIEIEIPELNLRNGAGNEYPQWGTGTIKSPSSFLDTHQTPAINKRERLAHIRLDVPFKKTMTDQDGRKHKVEVSKIMWVPLWLLKPAPAVLAS